MNILQLGFNSGSNRNKLIKPCPINDQLFHILINIKIIFPQQRNKRPSAKLTNETSGPTSCPLVLTKHNSYLLLYITTDNE